MGPLLLTILLAAPVQREHIAVELVAEHESVRPGARAWVGVHLRLDPHWHVYWKNPGDSGEPPKIRWDLPAGVTVSEIRWPAPKRIPRSGLMMYGYEGEVLLPVEVDVPEGVESLPLRAKVSWLVCDEVCIADDAGLELTLPVRAGEPRPGPHASLFERTRAALPEPLDVQLARHGASVALVLPDGIEGATFFPEEPGVIEHAAPQTLRDGRLELTLAGASVDRLRGVLVDAEGRAHAVDAGERAAVADNPEPFAAFPSVFVLLLLAGALFLAFRRRRGETR